MIIEGKWYTYNSASSRQLNCGCPVKVLSTEGETHALVWPMGPARTDDEAGILVHNSQLAGTGKSSAHDAKKEHGA